MLLAQEGKRVVRPKGGDPLIFGRGGEAAAALAEAGIACGVVPGITACAAQAAMQLTHRDAARMLPPVTGHTRDGRPDLDFATLGRPGQDSTPAAVIGNGRTAPRHPWRGTDPAPSCAGPPATVTTHDQPAQDARRAIQDHPPA